MYYAETHCSTSSSIGNCAILRNESVLSGSASDTSNIIDNVTGRSDDYHWAKMIHTGKSISLRLDHSDIIYFRMLANTISDCESYLELEENWDGYGAPKISKAVVDEVIEFICTIPRGYKLPNTGPSADNEILCSWRKKTDVVMISFFGDAKCHCYAKVSGEKYYVNNIELKAGEINHKILEFIKNF